MVMLFQLLVIQAFMQWLATELQSLTAPMVLQTYAEVEFLKAEAAIRGWISTSDKDHYEAGVTARMKMLRRNLWNCTNC